MSLQKLFPQSVSLQKQKLIPRKNCQVNNCPRKVSPRKNGNRLPAKNTYYKVSTISPHKNSLRQVSPLEIRNQLPAQIIKANPPKRILSPVLFLHPCLAVAKNWVMESGNRYLIKCINKDLKLAFAQVEDNPTIRSPNNSIILYLCKNMISQKCTSPFLLS